MTLTKTIPALPVRSVSGAAAFYRDRLSFTPVHHDATFAVMSRDAAVVHLWQADDETWRQRVLEHSPVRSGAESFLAGTASCRIEVDRSTAVDRLFAELQPREVLHPVSVGGPVDTDFGTREFSVLDVDGNLVGFFSWRQPEPCDDG
jgi:hypothetical protein